MWSRSLRDAKDMGSILSLIFTKHPSRSDSEHRDRSMPWELLDVTPKPEKGNKRQVCRVIHGWRGLVGCTHGHSLFPSSSRLFHPSPWCLIKHQHTCPLSICILRTMYTYVLLQCFPTSSTCSICTFHIVKEIKPPEDGLWEPVLEEEAQLWWIPSQTRALSVPSHPAPQRRVQSRGQ